MADIKKLLPRWHIEVDTGGGDDGLTFEDRHTILTIVDKLLQNGRQLKLKYHEIPDKKVIPSDAA